MNTIVQGTVRHVGNHYADGTPRLEIWVPVNKANGLPFKFNEPVPIDLSIGHSEYQGVFRSTSDNSYVWVSPTLHSSTGARHTLGRVLIDSAFQANDRVSLVVNDKSISVRREDAESSVRPSKPIAPMPAPDLATPLPLIAVKPPAAGTHPTLNIEAIKHRLFASPIVRAQLQRDYMLADAPADPNTLVTTLLASLNQTPIALPLECRYTNADVFKAAVRAIGSNSRSWASFLRHEHRLAELLGAYDPSHTCNAVQRGALRSDDLAACLPGQTSRNDANAILKWASLLAQFKDYYSFIRQLGHAFQHLAKRQSGDELSDRELMLCIVGYIGNPPARWEGDRFLSVAAQFNRKTPGMSYVLASEFMRNLGWEGFKPDRHVKRLFDRWLPNQLCSDQLVIRGRRLTRLIGCNHKDLGEYLQYSLVGADIAPAGMPLSHADNVVWLLGAYIEKKGRESNRTYVTVTN